MGRHHLWYVKGYTVSFIHFLSYQTTSSLNYNYLCLEVHCMRYELRLFIAKAFPLLKLIMTSTGWGAVITIFKVFGMTRTSFWRFFHNSFSVCPKRSQIFRKSKKYNNIFFLNVRLYSTVGLEPETSPSRTGCATTEPNLLIYL